METVSLTGHKPVNSALKLCYFQDVYKRQVAVGWAEEDECGIDLAFRRADFTMYEKKQQMKRKRKQEELRSEPPECGCGGIKNETE